MSDQHSWIDELLSQVASGRLLPQDALQQFFLRKKAEEQASLTEEDHAFLTAMDAAETAQTVAKWCARNAAAQGGISAVEADLRRPGFFHPRRRPPLLTGTSLAGQSIMLFSLPGPADGGEYAEDCLRVGGSFSGAYADPVFLPVFISALKTALKGHGLPEPAILS